MLRLGEKEATILLCTQAPTENPTVVAAAMAQWLRALADLADNPALVLHIHMAAHNHLSLQFHGLQRSLLASESIKHACSAHTKEQAKHS